MRRRRIRASPARAFQARARVAWPCSPIHRAASSRARLQIVRAPGTYWNGFIDHGGGGRRRLRRAFACVAEGGEPPSLTACCSRSSTGAYEARVTARSMARARARRGRVIASHRRDASGRNARAFSISRRDRAICRRRRLQRRRFCRAASLPAAPRQVAPPLGQLHRRGVRRCRDPGPSWPFGGRLGGRPMAIRKATTARIMDVTPDERHVIVDATTTANAIGVANVNSATIRAVASFTSVWSRRRTAPPPRPCTATAGRSTRRRRSAAGCARAALSTTRRRRSAFLRAALPRPNMATTRLPTRSAWGRSEAGAVPLYSVGGATNTTLVGSMH